MCSYERAGWLGSRYLGFSNRDLGKRAKNLPYEHFSPVTGMKAGWILAVRMASSCIACCPHQKHPIQLQWYSFKSCRSYDRRKSYNCCVSPCLVCFSNFAPELVPRIFGRFSTRKPGWNSSYEPKEKFVAITGLVRSTGLMWRGPKPE